MAIEEALMRMRGMFLLSLAVGVLTACGSDQTVNRASPSPPSPTAASGTASAEQVAKEIRGKVKCPAKAGATRAAGAPVDDVQGVRPGMTWQEAANVVMCTHELLVVEADTSRRFNIDTHGQTIRQGFSARFAGPRVEKTSRQIMKEMQDDMMARSGNAVRRDVQPGQSKWYVSTIGVPDAERVLAVAREEWFEEGRNPTVASIEQALVQKYGAPGRADRNGGRVYLVWSHDPMGRPITDASPLYHRCNGNSDPDGGTNFSPDCGIVVVAQVFSLPSNPALSQYFQVGIIDQANGYTAITRTEQALQQFDAQRQAREVEAAARNADAPKL